MAENGKNKSAAPDGGTDSELLQAPITVMGQYVKDLSFENPNSPSLLASPVNDPTIDVDVNVDVQKQDSDNEYEVILAIRADAKAAGKQAFLVELSYAGVFQLGQELPEEHRHPVLLIECPRLLFPFARQIISDTTQQGGFMPLMLQPIDFVGIYEQQAGQQSAATGSQAPNS